MGKRTTSALCILAVGLLAGCAAEGGEPVVEVAEAESPAFHFASGTLELGDFDPDTLGDDLFDPCTEISAEEYAAAGMTGVEPVLPLWDEIDDTTNSCGIDSEPGVTKIITATRTNEPITREALGDEVWSPDSPVPGLFVHQRSAVDPNACYAQVDTRRGGISVAVSVSGLKKNTEDPCAHAIEQLEILYKTATI